MALSRPGLHSSCDPAALDSYRHVAQGPQNRPRHHPAVEHFRAMSPSPRQAFPVPAEIMFAGWADHGRAAAAGSPQGRGFDLPRRCRSGGPGPCRGRTRTEMIRLEGGQTMQNGPECLPKYHEPGPEGVMPKAFPVIDPEPPPSSPVPLRSRSVK